MPLQPFDQPLLPVPELPPTSVTGHNESSSLVSWSGIDILTQFPGPVSTGKVKPTQWGGIISSRLPDCEPGCTEHTDTLHDAVKLLKYTHSVSGRLFHSWDAKSSQEDIDWNRAVGLSTSSYRLSSPMELLNSLPIASTTLNAQLLQICKSSNFYKRKLACTDIQLICV